MGELWRLLTSPKVSTLGLLVLAVLGGVAALLLGYQGVAGHDYPPAETPYLVSGSLIGIALVGSGLQLISVHLDRVEASTEREQLASVQREALRLLADPAADA